MSDTNRVQIEILLGILHGDISMQGRQVHAFAVHRGIANTLDAAVFSGIHRCFRRDGTADRVVAARTIAERNPRRLSSYERELVFRNIVPDVASFLRWCFPLLALIRETVGDGQSMSIRRIVLAAVPPSHKWLRWVLEYLLSRRFREEDEEYVSETDFALSDPAYGITASLTAFEVLSEWNAFCAAAPQIPALQETWQRRIASLEHASDTGIARESVAVTHTLQLLQSEADALWGAIRRLPDGDGNPIIEHATPRFGKRLRADLISTGYCTEADADLDTIALDREKFWHTAIVIVPEIPPDAGHGAPRLTQIPETAGRVHTGEWRDSIARAVGKQPLRRMARRAGTHAASPPATQPTSRARVEIVREITLTSDEAASVAHAMHATQPVPISDFGERLAMHLSIIGCAAIDGDGVRLLPEEMARSTFTIRTTDHSPIADRFVTVPSGHDITERMWADRFLHACIRAKKRETLPLPPITRYYQFHILPHEADAILRLAAISPAMPEERDAVLGKTLVAIFRDAGYMTERGLHVGHFLQTIFVRAPDDIAPNALARYHALLEDEQSETAVLQCMDDLRIIAADATGSASFSP